MKKILIVFLVFVYHSTLAQLDGSYQYTINLNKVVADRILVELVPPKIEQDSAVFYLPKIIPGTYAISDFGRFVSDFKAVDSKGNELEINHPEVNTWIIHGNSIASISYWIDDTYDADMGETVIDAMGGTNIDKGQNFVLNNGGYFGYFSEMDNAPIELRVVRPENFYGSTALKFDQDGINPKGKKEFKKYAGNSRIDIFQLDDYHQLVDSPIMYSIPDTTSIFIEDTQVLVSVYSPGKNVESEFVAETIQKLLIAQKDYLGGKLPVKKYAFLFFFEELSKIADEQGALEHNYSSYYYLPDVSQESLEQSLIDIAGHEFFHIVTPLGVHSEEIEFFDFNHPKMSKHLWMYEGVTEYFAGHVQVRYGLINLEKYLEILRLKLIISTRQYDDNLPFTELSQNTLYKYPDQYNNVYEKGALIGMCLDIKLRELSDGKYGLQNLMADLTKGFGKSKPFKDDELFNIIEQLTYPEIGEFLRTYVSGPLSLPYDEIFELVGIEHSPYKPTETFTLGNFGIDLDGNKIIVSDVSNLNQFGKDLGYKEGDILLAFQGTPIPDNPYKISPYIENVLGSMIEGEDFTVLVQRKGQNGDLVEVALKAKTQKFKAFEIHVLEPLLNPSEKQLKLRNQWLYPELSEGK